MQSQSSPKHRNAWRILRVARGFGSSPSCKRTPRVIHWHSSRDGFSVRVLSQRPESNAPTGASAFMPQPTTWTPTASPLGATASPPCARRTWTPALAYPRGAQRTWIPALAYPRGPTGTGQAWKADAGTEIVRRPLCTREQLGGSIMNCTGIAPAILVSHLVRVIGKRGQLRGRRAPTPGVRRHH